MKVIIFDASTLITLSMNGLTYILEDLKKKFDGKFIITSDVKREVIDKPMTIKRFELEALRVNQLLNDKILEMPVSMKIKDELISSKTKEIKELANSMYEGRGENIRLIDSGEASCLALSKILNENKIPNVVAVDERTARLLGEKPENLKKIFQRKLHTDIRLKKENFDYFKGFKFIRSSELIYVAYKKGLIKLRGQDNRILDALLYALKFKGCAISDDEIREIKQMS